MKIILILKYEFINIFLAGFLKFIMKTFPDVYKRALLSVPQMRAVCQIFISSEIVTDIR